MKTREKTLLIMSITILTLILTFFVISQIIFISSASDNENRYTTQLVNEYMNALNSDLEYLTDRSKDWSEWDDTYNFMKGNKPSFFKSEFVNNTFMILHVNFIMLTDTSGNVIYAKAFNLQTNKDVPLPENLKNFTSDYKNFVQPKTGYKTVSGFISLSGTPTFVVSQPILKTDGTGPSAGSLILGRYITSEEINAAFNDTDTSVTVIPYDKSTKSSELKNAYKNLSNGTSIFVNVVDSNTITGYTLLNTLSDDPGFILKFNMARPIYKAYQISVLHLLVVILLLGIILGSLILYYLDKNLLNRLDKISSRIIYIGKTQDLSERIPVSGDDELSDLAISVNNMLNSLQKSKEKIESSEKRYRAIFENTGTGMIMANAENTISIVNTEFEHMTGVSKEKIENKRKLTDFIPPEYLKHGSNGENFHDADMNLVGLNIQNYELELEVRGEKRNFLATSTSIPDSGEILISIIDITERKKNEKLIKSSLKEKEVLLREIHHRVKNNLQIISTLLSMQADETDNEEIIDFYTESQNRIQSMALIHENLYQSTDISSINIKKYIKNLLNDIKYSYGTLNDRIKIEIDTEDYSLNIETAVPCGLIINELVSNSLKYAFPHDKTGVISVSLHEISLENHEKEGRKERKFQLKVKDNGIGLPDDFDIDKSTSLGLHLVTALTEQLEGHIKLEKNEGASFTIVFKELVYKKRF